MHAAQQTTHHPWKDTKTFISHSASEDLSGMETRAKLHEISNGKSMFSTQAHPSSHSTAPSPEDLRKPAVHSGALGTLPG
ncbi:hypothetical protein P7K49_008662, partial [Saguinus oedipus]